MKTGKIYKIICTQSNICYVGSTFNTLRDRWKTHKNAFGGYLKNNHSEVAIYPYFKQYGIENFKIILIKEYEVCDRKHLGIYEQLWINKLKSINKNNPFRIQKMYSKQYYQFNKDNIQKYKKEYHALNISKINEYHKEYRTNHKEKIQKYKNKKFICECGGKYVLGSKARHLKTNKHIIYDNNPVLLSP